jgi:hypothetical protein
MITPAVSAMIETKEAAQRSAASNLTNHHYKEPLNAIASTKIMQMFLNPILAMLFNAKENRWHPILFLESPLPGPPDAAKPVRHKSKFHHTTGFPIRVGAIVEIEWQQRRARNPLSLFD